ncbi:hypothetical protein MVEN_01646800 [Mycena venus]|uniref:Uncharacterized protein n=1 Tax=Mycena venus TaxID=2733690 RepID=A0A8H6XQP6_9AGAR|nr:hypothetical protein MVEN_01646800 [Mycena venus]
MRRRILYDLRTQQLSGISNHPRPLPNFIMSAFRTGFTLPSRLPQATRPGGGGFQDIRGGTLRGDGFREYYVKQSQSSSFQQSSHREEMFQSTSSSGHKFMNGFGNSEENLNMRAEAASPAFPAFMQSTLFDKATISSSPLGNFRMFGTQNRHTFGFCAMASAAPKANADARRV